MSNAKVSNAELPGAPGEPGTGVSTGELVEALMRSAHRLRRSTARSLAPLGLTPAQERMLRLVSRGESPWRMGELASRMGIVPRSATSLVNGLEQVGLVERAIDPDNRRAILVRLTAHGQQVQRGMAQARAEAGEQLFAELNRSERAVLAALLEKVAPLEHPGHRDDVEHRSATEPLQITGHHGEGDRKSDN